MQDSRRLPLAGWLGSLPNDGKRLRSRKGERAVVGVGQRQRKVGFGCAVLCRCVTCWSFPCCRVSLFFLSQLVCVVAFYSIDIPASITAPAWYSTASCQAIERTGSWRCRAFARHLRRAGQAGRTDAGVVDRREASLSGSCTSKNDSSPSQDQEPT
jgi:hypothetical protein